MCFFSKIFRLEILGKNAKIVLKRSFIVVVYLFDFSTQMNRNRNLKLKKKYMHLHLVENEKERSNFIHRFFKKRKQELQSDT